MGADLEQGVSLGNIYTPPCPAPLAPMYPPLYPAAGAPGQQVFGYPAGPGVPSTKGDDNHV